MHVDNSHRLREAALPAVWTASPARVQAALDQFEQHRGEVTVTAVAAQVGVSRTFLHDGAQQDLPARLYDLAARQTSPRRPPLPRPQQVTAASHQQVVRALRKRNQQLVQENQRFMDELAIALGQLRELKKGTKHAL
jgi:hypothetical protein